MKSPALLITIAASLLVPLAASAADKARPKSAFASADTNADGKISAEEFVSSHQGRLEAAQARARFAELDRNKDGSLSRQEFSAARAGGTSRKKKDMPSN